MAPALHTAGFRKEVTHTARLAVPLAAGHLSHGLVSFIDTVVAGHHSTATLAATMRLAAKTQELPPGR